ncbi:cathepsin c [Stylonychia lemnae]|uniref:Cathepsin c n=1 Tax=Stylonychia lemnae TaxID=5949 RepID=A0A078ACG2_STYLE|nr:cathepsin c [Stylonychia lemnae]|eukprot:CDW78518.1 cathepsin c [Stylonychia lemnae]
MIGLREQILGEWEFVYTTEEKSVDIFKIDTVCTHQTPNSIQIVKPDSQFQFSEGTYSKFQAELSDSGKTSIQIGGKSINAHWSMLYDQGLILDSEEYRFFANYKYTIQSDVKYEFEVAGLEVSSYDSFNSQCNSTMIGLIQNKKNPGFYRCFFANKLDHAEIKSEEEIQADISEKIVFLAAQVKKSNILAQTKYEDLDNMVQFVNENDFTWQAGINNRLKGQTLSQLKMHHDGNQMKFAQKTLVQTNSISNTITDSDSDAERLIEDEDFKAIQKEAIKFIDSSLDKMSENDLPDQWDWRNVSDYDFTTPVKDQKGCGSCYAMSFTETMEARVKIKYGKSIPLSAQFLLDCNFYNEGCSGGWPLLNGFFSADFSIPSEACAPYKGYTVGNECSDHSNCQEKVKVSEANYIGGAYGMSSELLMMKEIRARGPIVSDLNVPLTFSYYRNGIFSDDHELQLKKEGFKEYLNENSVDEVTDRTLRDYHIEWQYINHSIMIVGWGEEDGVKYWICRNSYGDAWGEQGHFRIRRGLNDYGIESAPSYYIPIMQ